jgi:hypothetical protein
MPTASLRFRLPKEQYEFNAACRAQAMKSVIWEIDQYCRGILKHGDPSEETAQILERIREMAREDIG